MFELITNNDAHIVNILVNVDNTIVEVRTWDNRLIKIICSDLYGIKNYTWIGEDIGDITFSRDSILFDEMICAQFNSNRENVPTEIKSMKICSAWDNHIILEIIASKFAAQKVIKSSLPE